MRFLYYSTQTTLADRIARRYFNNTFFAYCAAEFSPLTNPGSASPASLYHLYRRIVEEDDRGNPKIKDYKSNLKAVARKKLAQGKINPNQYDALVWEVNHAETRDFAPILYLILKSAVLGKTTPVPIHKRANPNSEEYTIEELSETEFEMITTEVNLGGGI